MAPSLPIKLVFLSPPALLSPFTGGAAAAAARTMGLRVPAGYRLPAPPYGPCRGRSYFPFFSNTQAQGPGERCRRGTVSSQRYRRSHR